MVDFIEPAGAWSAVDRITQRRKVLSVLHHAWAAEDWPGRNADGKPFSLMQLMKMLDLDADASDAAVLKALDRMIGS